MSLQRDRCPDEQVAAESRWRPVLLPSATQHLVATASATLRHCLLKEAALSVGSIERLRANDLAIAAPVSGGQGCKAAGWTLLFNLSPERNWSLTLRMKSLTTAILGGERAARCTTLYLVILLGHDPGAARATNLSPIAPGGPWSSTLQRKRCWAAAPYDLAAEG